MVAQIDVENTDIGCGFPRIYETLPRTIPAFPDSFFFNQKKSLFTFLKRKTSWA
jgi:hypothetical protein